MRINPKLRFACMVVAAVFSARAQTLSVLSPKSGDVLYTGDTVMVKWTADKAFVDKMSAKALSITISPDEGINWGAVKPAGRNKYPVGTTDTLWEKTPIVIPESLLTYTVNGADSLISAVSEKVMFKLLDYGNGDVCYATTQGVLTIRPANEKPAPAKKEAGGCGMGAGLAFIPPVMVKLAKRRKGRSVRPSSIVLIALCVALTGLFAGCFEKTETTANQLPGTWEHIQNKAVVRMVVGSDSTFTLKINDGTQLSDMDFKGTLTHLVKDTVRIVDTYCGNRLPGTYRITLKAKDLFTLDVVSDSFCTRRVLYPGEWNRVKQPGQQASSK